MGNIDSEKVLAGALEGILAKLDGEAAKSFADKAQEVSAENVEATGKSGA